MRRIVRVWAYPGYLAAARLRSGHESDTLCVVPWSSLVVEPDGCAKFCCDAPELLQVDGRIGRLGPDTLDDLWNSEGLVSTRAAMAAGERPAACRSCWEKEDRGITSRRAVYNGVYERSGGDLSIPALAEVGADTGYRLDRAPDWFVVELGSVCNLRCRAAARSPARGSPLTRCTASGPSRCTA